MRPGTVAVTIGLLGPFLFAGCAEDPPAQTFDCSAPGFVLGSVHLNVTTNKGTFMLELYGDKAPATVCNFLTYVDEKFYDDTCFHRIVKGFVVQGGGMATDSCGRAEKETHDPIPLETTGQLRNYEQTIAMARTSVPDSGTSQFFLNVANNSKILDWDSPNKPGYAVFGKVTSGYEVVKTLETFGVNDGAGKPTGLVYVQTIRTMTH